MQKSKIVLDLDDFCEEIMGEEEWDCVNRLRDHYPNLKINMFTIPDKCSTKWLAKMTKIPWIEMYYHGTWHENKNEFMRKKPPFAMPHLDDWAFQRVFKAPWWRLSRENADLFDAKDFIIATNRHFYISGRKVYTYDNCTGIEKNMYYYGDGLHRWHGHMQSQKHCNKRNPNGLPDIIDKFIDVIPQEAEFVFITDLFPRKLNLGCSIYAMNGWENYDLIEKWRTRYSHHAPIDDMHNLDLTRFPLPFPDNQISAVLISHTLNQIPSKKRVPLLKEIHRILRRGCTVRIIDDDNEYVKVHKHSLAPTSDTIVGDYLLEAGFKEIVHFITPNATTSYHKDICVDHHTRLGKGRFFIEGVKW